MMNRQGAAIQNVQALFTLGTIGGLTDGELLGRFADHRDDVAELAFAALLERHGPMVLRVCRSILRNEHDAQDAFQGTFLVLARRAHGVRKRESVASWLHGVALRVAACEQTAMAHRRRHETRASQMAAARVSVEGSSPDLSTILHEELGRLPEQHRSVVVLCYLEGHTCEAAARQLGWPVGTVKSRLSRARERLRGRLLRRGLAPDEASSEGPASAGLVPATLAKDTVEAMVRVASAQSNVGFSWARVVSWILFAGWTTPPARFVAISAVLILAIAAAGVAMFGAGRREPAQRIAQAAAVVQKREPEIQSPNSKQLETIVVRVIDGQGRGVANVEVELIDYNQFEDGPRYRTEADGRIRISIDPSAPTHFLARPDSHTLGWAYRAPAEQSKGKEGDPIPLVLLPRDHTVEGSVVDASGKAIRGVRITVAQVVHDINQSIAQPALRRETPLLGAAISDENGRYKLSLPEKTKAVLSTFHPRYVGPAIECRADQPTIAPVTLEDAGGIAGTIVDSVTRRPVAGARLGANRIEIDSVRRIASGYTKSDADGRFRIESLDPGVYNVRMLDSPRGDRFTAQAIEGVRVTAREYASADLNMVAGRRVHGSVIDSKSGKPMNGVSVCCINPSFPESGGRGQHVHTDSQGNFEFFVLPGVAYVYLAGIGPHLDGSHLKVLNVSGDQDPPLVVLKAGADDDVRTQKNFTHEVPVRVTSRLGNDRARDVERTLIGRIFDQRRGGVPVAGVQVGYFDRRWAFNFVSATDQSGTFRLTVMPREKFVIIASKLGYASVSATIPPDAREVELSLESLPTPAK